MSEIVDITLLQLSWDDILFQHVLPFLTLKDCFNLRSTCKLCRELVDSYFAIIKNINISLLKTFNGPAFNVFVENCRSIRHINLAYCNWFEDKLLKRLFYNNEHLSYVNLSGCLGLTSACLQPLIFFCKDLKSLKLKNCHWVTVDCIEALTFHQNNLEEIDLTSCWDLGDESLIAFIKKFRRQQV